MDRLTNRTEEYGLYAICRNEDCDTPEENCIGWFRKNTCPTLDRILEKLEQYENTGLTPEEITNAATGATY